jgi:hypothetical protein
MEEDRVMSGLQRHLVKATVSTFGTRRNTWMKAVPIMTPVPKCLTEKNTHSGILRPLTRFATMGNIAPIISSELRDYLPNVDVRRMATRAAIWRPNSNSWELSTVSSGVQEALSPKSILRFIMPEDGTGGVKMSEGKLMTDDDAIRGIQKRHDP